MVFNGVDHLDTKNSYVLYTLIHDLLKKTAEGYQSNLESQYSNLVGGWTNPSEKYARQIGFIFPNFRGEHSKNIWVATT